jgi:hypothetical protein
MSKEIRLREGKVYAYSFRGRDKSIKTGRCTILAITPVMITFQDKVSGIDFIKRRETITFTEIEE